MYLFKKKLAVKAPAKINLHLEVLDRRQDGFHNLQSVFLALDFCDILRFELKKDKKINELTIKGLDLDIIMEENIIFRSLKLFRERTGFDEGIKVTLEKHIPPGGGLGGGSSDAAAVLLALNKLSGFPLDRGALLETAAELGSDISFFIHQTAAALVTGRGGIIEPIEAPRLYFVLVNPGFQSGTAAAFRLLSEYRQRVSGGTVARGGFADKESLLEMLGSSPEKWNFRNDFLDVFGEEEKSVYVNIIDGLRKLGAEFAGLSGSGSSCFGVFRESGSAHRASAVLRKKWHFVEYCGLWRPG